MSSRRFSRLLDALFGDAWRLQRRRRRRWLLLALVACAAVTAIVLLVRGSGGSSHAASAGAARAVLASRVLPTLGQSPELSVAGGRLIVSDADNMRVVAGRVLGTCTSASVDPLTLRVVSLARGNCGDPALYGRGVLPVVYQVSRNPGPGWGTDELGIRMAIVARSASRGYTLGPLLVGYPDCSTCRVQVIDGPGAVWVYAPLTRPGAPGELLRISQTTGRVTHRWVLPTQMIRVLLATDTDGLWFAPGVDTCCSGPRSSWRREGFLYHVSPDSRAPMPVLDVGGGGASWLVASGHTIWVQARSQTRHAPRWTLDSTRIRSVVTVPGGCFDPGEGSPMVLGTPAIGIYCVASNLDNQGVIRLDPDGQDARTVAILPTTQEYATPDSAVVFNGSYYFLDPADTIRSGAGSPLDASPSKRSPAVLYRITSR
ncbi:MAG: hypothetical protein ACLP8S_15010 [Solirubrobacteraceae bacterium]